MSDAASLLFDLPGFRVVCCEEVEPDGRLGVGVDPDANLNAPASYTTRIRLAHGAPTAEETTPGGADS